MKLFDNIKNTVLEPFTSKPKTEREYHLGYKIAGITFKNEDGTNRQDILKSLKEDDPLELKAYDYNGKTAIGIYTKDGKQLGNIKDDEIAAVLKNMATMTKCTIHDIDKFSDGFGKTIYYAYVVIYFK